MDRVLKKFDIKPKDAIKHFEKYILKGIDVETEFDFKSGCIAGMVGNRAFVEEIMVTTCAIKHKKIELTELIKRICEIHNITQEQLCMPGKRSKNSLASSLLAFLSEKLNIFHLHAQQ